MSYAMRIDYQGISIECQSICTMASNQLCKLDKMIDEIEQGSTKLLNSQTEALKDELLQAKQDLQNQINLVIKKAQEKAKEGTVVVDSDYMGKHAKAYKVIEEANELELMVNRLTSERIIEFESLLNQLLGERIEAQNQRLKDLASGRIRINHDVQNRINKINDEIIRQYVYLAWLEKPNDSFDSLYKIAIMNKEKADDQQYEASEESKIEEIKAELRAEKVDEKTIKTITATTAKTAKERIKQVRELANNEIIGEKVRKESIKIILAGIKKRGFIVDMKQIVLDRERNLVRIIAKKPSGARAEFKVFLDGKFEYKFDGYEGQACQKDIQPFMKDLEEVYGMKVVNETILWTGNPDRESAMRQQALGHNVNRR